MENAKLKRIKVIPFAEDSEQVEEFLKTLKANGGKVLKKRQGTIPATMIKYEL